MPRRILSPSSINLYNQCPRRFYYQYMLKLPTKPSIHLIRGSIVHEVLEKFFSLDLNLVDEDNYHFFFRSYLTAYLLKLWNKNKDNLSKLKMTGLQLEQYLIDSQNMLTNFANRFSEKLEEDIKKTNNLIDSFKHLAPAVEEKLVNEELGVMGYIDAIHESDDGIVIVDYKTSSKDALTEEYQLQLSIYALMYKLKHDILPKRVGINFLKFGEKYIDVTEDMLSNAKNVIEETHKNIISESIQDYPRKESGLCKWSSGQCDFYDVCVRNK